MTGGKTKKTTYFFHFSRGHSTLNIYHIVFHRFNMLSVQFFVVAAFLLIFIKKVFHFTHTGKSMKCIFPELSALFGPDNQMKSI